MTLPLDSSPPRVALPRRISVQLQVFWLWVLNCLLLVLLGLVTPPEILYAVYAFFIAWLVGAAAVLLGTKKVTFAQVLLGALALRLVVALAIEAFPPISPPSSLRYVPGVIWEDETYYVTQARILGESLAQFLKTNWGNPYERVAGLYALVFLITSEATVWGRLLNVLIGAMTAVLLYDSLALVTSPRIRRWIFWYVVASPVLLQFSIVYLKEGLLVFGITLLVNAIVRIYLGGSLARQFPKLLIGAVLGATARNTSLLPLVMPLGVSLFYPWQRIRRSRKIFWPVFVVFSGVVGAIAVAPLQVARMASSVLQIQGLGTMEISSEFLAQGGEISSVPLFALVARLPAVLQGAGFLFLLTINPVITSVWSLIALLGTDNWWLAYGVSSYALSWWISLPFVVRAVYDSVRQRSLWWFSWSASLLVWMLIAGNARFGVGYDAFRYRDSLTPVTMLLAAKGLDSTLHLADQRQGKWWRWIVKFYFAAVVLLIMLRALNIIGS